MIVATRRAIAVADASLGKAFGVAPSASHAEVLHERNIAENVKPIVVKSVQWHLQATGQCYGTHAIQSRILIASVGGDGSF